MQTTMRPWVQLAARWESQWPNGERVEKHSGGVADDVKQARMGRGPEPPKVPIKESRGRKQTRSRATSVLPSSPKSLARRPASIV
jgi:hypothetical protein